MLKTLAARIQQKHRTLAFPKKEPELPDRFRGLPFLKDTYCDVNCRLCAHRCPTQALSINQNRLEIDIGRCIFCTECATTCPNQNISFSQNYRLAARKRKDLIRSAQLKADLQPSPLYGPLRKLLGRSLRLRQVSAGGCNACEADTNVLSTVVFDLARFGIQFVASPRHADGLLITGPVTKQMELALKKTYEAVPEPKIVIALGTCAISGGPFRGNPEVFDGVGSILPVDLLIPGCPPHPLTTLRGILDLLGKIPSSQPEQKQVGSQAPQSNH